jgi:hypothetical protein
MPNATTQPQPATDEPPKRTKAPSVYHVFLLVEGAWKQLTERGVKATSKKGAIEKATERLEEKAGTFVAVKEAEWAPIPRKLEQKTESVWG